MPAGKRGSGDKDIPGPGGYRLVSTNIYKEKAPSYSFGSKRASRMRDTGPGPGAYRVPSSLEKKGASIKGKPKSAFRRDDSGPGPGAYNVRASSKDRGPAYTMRAPLGRARAGGKQPRDDGPGPGQHQRINRPSTAPAASIKSRWNHTFERDGPGPGQYDTSSRGRHGPAFTMSSKSRVDTGARRSRATPGPGAYKDRQSFGSNAPKVRIAGRSNYDPILAEAKRKPSPGDYTPVDPNLKPQGGYTMSGRRDNLTSAVSPSPSKDKKKKTPVKTGLGPGAYNIRREFGSDAQASSFGSPHRHKETLGADSPGPGAYGGSKSFKAERTNLKEGPAFSLGGRPKDRARDDVPGPGNYNVTPKSEGKGISIGRGGRDDVRISGVGANDSPGPGSYDVRPKTAGPAFTLSGHTSSPVEQGSDSPGPGAYGMGTTRSRVAGGHMGTKSGGTNLLAAFEASPGPGAYSVKDLSGHGPAVSIGRRTEYDMSSHDGPGPGAYKVESKLGRAPGVKMGAPPSTAHGGGQSYDGPGPGQYKLPDGDTGPKYSMGGKYH